MNEQQQRDHGVVHMIVYGCIIATFVLVVYGVFVNREITVHTNTMTADQVITVDGMAEAFVVPDTAKVSFGVTAKNRSTTVATQSVNERMQNLVDALEKTGVEKKDVKTISYTLSPEYTYTDNAQRFDGYRVSQRVEITIRDLDTVSAVLDLVNSAGVDDVSQLTFFVDDEDAVREQLRTDAIADARRKAKEIAKDLDVQLGNVVSFNEDRSGDVPRPLYAAGMRAMDEVKESAAAVIPTGENNLVTRVHVTFTIR